MSGADELVLPPGLIRGRVLVAAALLVRDFGPIAGFEIQAEVGVHRAVVSKAMQRLHAAGVVYIQSWTHPGASNTLAPVWAWRTGQKQRDAAKPARKTQTAINQDWNRRHAAYRLAKQRHARGNRLGVWSGLM